MKISTLTSAMVLAVALGSTAACAATGSSNEKAMYEKAKAVAEQSIARAEEVKNNWTTTNKLMKEAEELAKKGDYALATEKAEEADFLAQRAREQFETQPNPGPWR
ncbi:MAG: hypothetical protein ACOC00_04310 [Halothiobacillaceae bacterium]